MVPCGAEPTAQHAVNPVMTGVGARPTTHTLWSWVIYPAFSMLIPQGDAEALLPTAVLQQMAAYDKQPIIATTGSILLATAGVTPASQAAVVDSSTAIMAIPQHQDLELAALAKLCYACAKPEGRDVKLLRCSACGVCYYCSSTCQKADWKVNTMYVVSGRLSIRYVCVVLCLCKA